MANEFDDLTRAQRRRIFSVWSWANGITASVLLVFLLRCMDLRRKESNDLWNQRLNDLKEQAREAGDRKIREATQVIDPKIEETQRRVDSLTAKLDSLNSKRS